VAFTLSVILTVFMSAEVSHRHPPGNPWQHYSCPWCSIAHLAPTLISPLLTVAPAYCGESVDIRECVETALLVIPLQFIRPPPILNHRTEHMRTNTNNVTRNTKQKDAIRSAFVETGRPLSPEEVLSYAQRNVPDLSIATVYRNLKIMLEEKWLTAVQLPGESPRYEISGKAHHHHFWCNGCGKVYELEGCTPRLKAKLPRGFRALHHDLLLYGTCAACVPGRA
jgi:Fur family transcriptional regulator, ferric uptake regulator